MGELLNHHTESSGSRLSIKNALPLPLQDTHMNPLLFLSIKMHLEESKQPQKSQNSKYSVGVCMRVCVADREKSQMFLCPCLPFSHYLPSGVSYGRGYVHSVVTSTRCAPLTQIT